MPEGHSVHRISRVITDLFRASHPGISSPQGRFTAGAKLLSGREFISADAVGKQLFLHFEDEAWMRVHLGIYGAWDFARASGVDSGIDVLDEAGEDSLSSIGAPRVSRLRIAERETRDLSHEALAPDFPPEPVGQVRVRLLTEDAVADLRGPTVCEVLTASEVAAVLDRLGPDPANSNTERDQNRFIDRASKKRTPIGLVLMDQSVIAGIGNVYRAELLFRAGINPHTSSSELTRDQLAALWLDWAYLLDIGISVGQMLTIDGLQGDAYREALHKRSARHWVYKREGLPCLRCDHNIALEIMANRKLYWCPGCQH